MNEKTRAALLAVNRVFYDDYAGSFGETRARPWPAWTTLLAEPAAETETRDRPLRILDVGCGNGRFGLLASQLIPGPVIYEGWDQSVGLLDQARERLTSQVAELDLKPVDLGQDPGHWPVTEATFDVIGMFGVLHHMPGLAFRRRLLEALGRRLAPGGRLWVSWWLLHRTERFSKKTQPWSRLDEDGARSRGLSAVDPDELEPGDFLLSWQRDGFGLRYLHFPTDDELAELRDLPGLEPGPPLESDGPTGRENLYLRWTRSP